MSDPKPYTPGPATGARANKEGEKWTLILVRDLRHPPEKVWRALTDPAHLTAWAPFDADRSLAAVGPVKLSTVGTPSPQISETAVTCADAPTLLEYTWGAAGWHIGLDVLDRLLAGEPIGRIAGPAAMQFKGWQRLVDEYKELL